MGVQRQTKKDTNPYKFEGFWKQQLIYVFRHHSFSLALSLITVFIVDVVGAVAVHARNGARVGRDFTAVPRLDFITQAKY